MAMNKTVHKILTFTTIDVRKDECEIIDQTLLPERFESIIIRDYKSMGDAIKRLAVRGAPAIGIAASAGLYLGIKNFNVNNYTEFKIEFDKIKEYLQSTRPTAVNLFWALEEMEKVCIEFQNQSVNHIIEKLFKKAREIQDDDTIRCNLIGENAIKLVKEGMTGITYCNAGALATGGIGTALSVFYKAKEKGINLKAISCETRPLLQGARLTCWELTKNGIDTTLICDNTIAQVMDTRKIDFCIVGADRIATNGDTANKIGTCSLAVNAKVRKIPFYVAAPLSTFDVNIETGKDIPIEERDPAEVVMGFGKRTAPEGIKVYAPAFDVTPNEYITAIITEKGILKAPFKKTIKKLKF